MKKIITKIFENKNFYTDSKSEEGVSFWKDKNKENQEYFLIAKYTKEEIFDFFDSNKTNSLISFFDNLKKKEENYIEKNTSLIILLETNSLNELSDRDLKNEIFKIEEDEYFFRKYVISYTIDSIENIKLEDIDENYINKNINDIEKFSNYQENPYQDSEYFVFIQLLIKLPFLSFESRIINTHQTIDSILNSKIQDRQLKISAFNHNMNNLKDIDPLTNTNIFLDELNKKEK